MDVAENARCFSESETLIFVGRGVATLAAYRDVHQKLGQASASWCLAKEYSFKTVRAGDLTGSGLSNASVERY